MKPVNKNFTKLPNNIMALYKLSPAEYSIICIMLGFKGYKCSARDILRSSSLSRGAVYRNLENLIKTKNIVRAVKIKSESVTTVYTLNDMQDWVSPNNKTITTTYIDETYYGKSKSSVKKERTNNNSVIHLNTIRGRGSK